MAEKIHKSNIITFEWGLLVGVLLLIDVIQIILNFLAVGVAVNRIINIIVALSLAFYLIIRGETKDPGTRNRIITIIIASFAAETVPILDSAPFWTIDGIYFWQLAKKRNKKAEEEEAATKALEENKKIQSQQERIVKLQEIRERQVQQQEDLYEEDR
jgi:hypothetical protein